MSKTKKMMKGFAVMSKAMQRKICTMGGMAVSQNRRHMQKLGRLGGTASAKSRRQVAKHRR